jgi:hypothetical protein
VNDNPFYTSQLLYVTVRPRVMMLALPANQTPKGGLEWTHWTRSRTSGVTRTRGVYGYCAKSAGRLNARRQPYRNPEALIGQYKSSLCLLRGRSGSQPCRVTTGTVLRERQRDEMFACDGNVIFF